MAMTPHQKIKRAALNGTGLRLTPDEVFDLYFGDAAIKAAADSKDGWDGKQPATSGSYAKQLRASRAQ